MIGPSRIRDHLHAGDVIHAIAERIITGTRKSRVVYRGLEISWDRMEGGRVTLYRAWARTGPRAAGGEEIDKMSSDDPLSVVAWVAGAVMGYLEARAAAARVPV